MGRAQTEGSKTPTASQQRGTRPSLASGTLQGSGLALPGKPPQGAERFCSSLEQADIAGPESGDPSSGDPARAVPRAGFLSNWKSYRGVLSNLDVLALVLEGRRLE